MPDLLLEVGTEEMPANAVAPALDQLRDQLAKRLVDTRLGAESIEVWGTPRRLIAIATDVPARQPDEQREAKGPSKLAAYDPDGNPTGAAIGFARKQGIPVEALRLISTPQGEYVVADVLDQGKTAAEVLGRLIADSLSALTFPKMMLWGTGETRFVRPVRWIVSMLGSEVIPLEFGGVKSGRQSRGHRFLAPEPFDVESSQGFLDRLRAAYVEPDSEARKHSIVSQADVLAEMAGGSIPWDEGLLDENTWLVEWPTALLGSFDDEYLQLPRPVLVTAMKKHQRFFPIEDSTGKLLAKFVSIRNGATDSIDIVREGNERVLKARFNDAQYFFKNDRRQKLEAFVEKLGRILFQEKLGTLNERRQRLELLVGAIADSLGMNQAEKSQAVRAANLCKADLATQMVIELPAIQGIIGREYALADGEDEAAADAIAEHYKPRSAGDSLPGSRIGKALALADRTDTLVGYVGQGILPSGSSDPYALRRAAAAVVQILAEEPEYPSLLEIQVHACEVYRQVNRIDFDLDRLCNDLKTLFDQRISAYIDERGVRYDLIDAALSGGAIYSTLVYATVRRATTLQNIADDPQFVPTVNSAGRVARILKPSAEPAPLVPGKEAIFGQIPSVERAVSVLQSEERSVNQSLLSEAAEKSLFESASRIASGVARKASDYDYANLFKILTNLNPVVDRFFDEVMVMADDPALRRNRLALLTFVDSLYKTLADFTKVVVL